MRATGAAAIVLLGLLCVARAAGIPQPPTFAEVALRELRALSPGVTPAAWLATHGDDEFERFEHPLWRRQNAVDVHWCARARHGERIEGRELWVRHAYFFVPEASSPAVLPSEEEAGDLVMTRCQLGMIRVEAKEPELAAGQAAALALREILSRAYGPSPATTPMSLLGSGLNFGSAWFDSMSHWRVGELHVLSAYRKRRAGEASAAVFAIAALPISGMAAYRQRASGGVDALSADEALITQAVVTGGLDGAGAEPVRRALRWIRDASSATGAGPPAADPPDVASIIERWLAAVPSSRGRERAAALIVAHVLLARASLPSISSEGQARLRAHVARFVSDPSDEGPPSYAGNWLRDAWVLDKEGAVGDVALPLLLADPCACPGRQDCFRWTIKEGERFLSRPHDRETMLQAHLVVASAYSYGVALAEGAEEEEIDAQPYRARPDEYRAKAIAHYRVAFSMGLSADAVEEHWDDAWRLVAGLPPLRTSFRCGC
ncbi:MAG: hypothetical protein E6J71_05755 [Deltaproteobacteria bacterium]|nr:MAG: hypothetical protein E6J71_05755 [Deltaproteobacteria bacterium]